MASITAWWRCKWGRHVIWLGDLKRASGDDPTVVDSPCLECGALVVRYGISWDPKIRTLWHLDQYMPLDEAYAYQLAVQICNRSGDERVR